MEFHAGSHAFYPMPAQSMQTMLTPRAAHPSPFGVPYYRQTVAAAPAVAAPVAQDDDPAPAADDDDEVKPAPFVVVRVFDPEAHAAWVEANPDEAACSTVLAPADGAVDGPIYVLCPATDRETADEAADGGDGEGGLVYTQATARGATLNV